MDHATRTIYLNNIDALYNTSNALCNMGAL